MGNGNGVRLWGEQCVARVDTMLGDRGRDLWGGKMQVETLADTKGFENNGLDHSRQVHNALSPITTDRIVNACRVQPYRSV